MLLNSDTIWHEDTVTPLVQYLQQHEEGSRWYRRASSRRTGRFNFPVNHYRHLVRSSPRTLERTCL